MPNKWGDPPILKPKWFPCIQQQVDGARRQTVLPMRNYFCDEITAGVHLSKEHKTMRFCSKPAIVSCLQVHCYISDRTIGLYFRRVETVYMENVVTALIFAVALLAQFNYCSGLLNCSTQSELVMTLLLSLLKCQTHSGQRLTLLTSQ